MIKSENSKLPNIYYPKQTIKQRNQIIDEYIQSLDSKNKNKDNNISLISDDEDDPFSSKIIKKDLILPNFNIKQKINSESSLEKRRKTILYRNKNKSENNIKNKSNNNSNLNNKWTKYSNYINHFLSRSKSHLEKNNKNKQKYFSTINVGFNNKKINIIKANKLLNNKSKVNYTEKIYSKLVKEKNNPYGINWINKMLKKCSTEKLGFSNNKINGVPIIKLIGKNEMNKKEIKKKLGEIQKKKLEEENKFNIIKNQKAKIYNNDILDDEYNIPINIVKQISNKN